MTLVIAVVIGAIFLLTTRLPQKNNQNGKIQIVTSFYPLSYVATAVGGNLVVVRNLVPAGVEPHDFEPSSRDLVEIGMADIFIFNGASLEPWVEKWTDGISEKPGSILNMSESLKKREVRLIERDGITDPHFWLDPTVMKVEADIVRDLLIEIDPAHKDFYVDNASRLSASLDALNQRFISGLSSCQLRDIVVLHEAFNYLGRQYHLYITSISGISPDEEPSPKELGRIINHVRAKGIKHIFAETVASPKFSELITREVGGEMLTLNPIESLTPNEVQLGEDYFSIMEMNLNNLQTAMQCN